MQKYSPIDSSTPNMQEDSENGSFYWCADADKRIADLVSAVESLSFVLSRQRNAMHMWDRTLDEAIDQAKKVIAVNS
jgi:hypothetical protein